MSSAYLLPNLVEFEESELAPRPRVDPLFIELVVVEGHDGLDAIPGGRARRDAEPSVARGGSNISVHYA